MRHRHLALAAGLALLLALAAGPALVGRAGEYDLVGMLRDLHAVNAEIEAVNGAILTALGNVQQESARAERLRERMVALEGGLREQRAVLLRLRDLTAEQARLSRRLQALTAEVRPHAAGLAQSARAQAGTVGRMGNATAGLAARMAEIEQVNRRTEERLRQAQALSAEILERMP